jgi:hypothetical protein
MKLRLASIALLLAIASAVLLAPFHSAEAKPATGIPVAVTGTFTDAVGGTGTFTGTFFVDKFTVQNGKLAAVGTLTGTLTDSLGNVLGTVTKQLTILVGSISATCEILHLELGPIDLDLLGLVVHVDKIVIDITAEQGPGNLLGNLLCAVAGLLDNGIALNTVAAQLNVILDVLKQLGLGFA